ncbi:hypothetical protein ACHAPU_009705 [Fusarium lateritium]
MKFSLPVVLFAGLGLAADPNVWDFDESCQTSDRLDKFTKAYNDAELLAVKAQDDLKMVLEPHPDFESKQSPRLRNWDRIARAVTNMFGFTPNKAGHDPNEEHYSNVRYVYDRMVKTLHGGQMVPENGYGGFKPLLMCDENMFVWVGRDDKDPNDSAGRPLGESRSGTIKPGHAGAWVYKKRYLASVNKADSPGLCRPGVWGITLTRYDFIIFCPTSFGDKASNTPSAVDSKDSVAVGNTLDSYSTSSLPRIMVHEFAHYFGSDGTGGPENRDVKDQPAVGKEGKPIYTLNGKYTNRPGPGATKVVTYDFLWCSNLARTHTDELAGNSGPSKSTFTAETYALFSLMSYMDNFDWADDGKAKEMKTIPYDQLPNGKRLRLEGEDDETFNEG